MGKFNEISQNYEAFEQRNAQFPTNTNSPKAIANEQLNNCLGGTPVEREVELGLMAESAKVILPPGVIAIYENFLAVQKRSASPRIKAIYGNMTLQDFIQRLLTKRPLTFTEHRDGVKFPNHVIDQAEESLKSKMINAYDHGWTKEFSTIGAKEVESFAEAETPPITLENFLSPDERRLAALMTTSAHTFCLNTVSRGNQGQNQEENAHQTRAVMLAQVGIRGEQHKADEETFYLFKENEQNDSFHWRVRGPRCIYTKELGLENVIVTRDDAGNYQVQNAGGMHKWDLGRSSSSSSASSASASQTLVEGVDYFRVGQSRDVIFHVGNYKRLMKMRVQAALAGAEQAGIDTNNQVSAFFVGLGIGNWTGPVPKEILTKCILELYAECLQEGNYPHISGITFSGFENTDDSQTLLTLTKALNPEAENEAKHETPLELTNQSGNKFNIAFSAGRDRQKQPASPEIFPGDRTQTRVFNISWDANSKPGNEYWVNQLDGSDDPAKACGTLFPVILETEINPELSRNVYSVDLQGQLQREPDPQPVPTKFFTRVSKPVGEVIVSSDQRLKMTGELAIYCGVLKVEIEAGGESLSPSELRFKETKLKRLSAIKNLVVQGKDCGDLIRYALDDPDFKHGVKSRALKIIKQIIEAAKPPAPASKFSSGL